MVKALDQQPSWILIHWAFINQIIVEVLAGWNAHDRIWSCHKDQIHQKSKLYFVPYIVPDIGTWHRNFILYCHYKPSISNNFIWYWKKNLWYLAQYSNLHVFATQYRASYRIFFLISKKNVSYIGPDFQFWPSLPPVSTRYGRVLFYSGYNIEYNIGT
jgi:hypothetical protein